MKQAVIYTIGHSVHPLEEFVAMLNSFNVKVLADIRNFPGSRRYPHFNREQLEKTLPGHHIRYVHFKDLGGRRKPQAHSVDTAWRLPAFRGYADHMQTAEFAAAAEQLAGLATQQTTAYMCSEAVWWSCHRALLSDYYKVRGWKVLHIMKAGKADEHPYTSAARIVNGKLSYQAEDLFGSSS